MSDQQHYGIKLPQLTTDTPGVILYGVTPDNQVIPIQVDDHGILNSSVTLIGDVVVGAFVITDPISNLKANVINNGIHNELVVGADYLPLPTGAATETTLALAKGYLLSLDSKFNTLGQKNSNGSVPVVLASDQLPLPVSATFSGTLNVGRVDQGSPAGVTQAWPVQFSDGSSFVDAADATHNALRVNIVSSQPLDIQAVSASGLTINGTITANQGGVWDINSVVQPISVQATSSSGLTVNISGTPTVNVNQPISIEAASINGLSVNGIGDFTVVQPTGTNLHTVIDSGTITANVQALSASGLTINGTVTASQSGTWSIYGISGTISLPTNAAQEIGGHLESLDSKFNTLGQKGMTQSVPVVLASDQSSIPVSQSGSWTVSLSSESIEIGRVDQGSPAGVTQAWPVKITDGTNIPGITNAIPLGTEQGLIVRTIPSGTQTISGTVSANIQAASASGLTINGTVTANIGTTNGLALDASVTGLQVSLGSTTAGQKGSLTLGAVTTAAPTYTTAQSSPLSLTTAGALRVDGSAVTQPVAGDVASGSADSGNPVKIGGVYHAAGLGLTEGQRGNIRLDADGDVMVNIHETATVKQATASTSSVTSVAGSASSVTLLAANANRRGASVFNDSGVNLFLKLGATASTTSFTVRIVPHAYYEVPFNYSDIIDGIWVSATGSARVTEIS